MNSFWVFVLGFVLGFVPGTTNTRQLRHMTNTRQLRQGAHGQSHQPQPHLKQAGDTGRTVEGVGGFRAANQRKDRESLDAVVRETVEVGPVDAEASEDAPEPTINLPVEVEAEIASLWSDNIVAAHLTRTVARAMVNQGKDHAAIQDAIRHAGRLV